MVTRKVHLLLCLETGSIYCYGQLVMLVTFRHFPLASRTLWYLVGNTYCFRHSGPWCVDGVARIYRACWSMVRCCTHMPRGFQVSR